MTATIVRFPEHTLADAAAMLRKAADLVEAGEFGEVESVGIVVLGDGLEVLGFGPKSDSCAIGMLLHAGFLKLNRMILDAADG